MKMLKVYYRDEFIGPAEEVYSTKAYNPNEAKRIAQNLELMGAIDIRFEEEKRAA